MPIKEAPVIYKQTKCPRCGSKACKVYSTSRPIRYHLCRQCDNTFRSIEVSETQLKRKQQATQKGSKTCNDGSRSETAPPKPRPKF